MKTKDKIVAASIELFNRYGVQNVPVNRIAAELGISPGNLNYHFKSKDMILQSIFPMIEAEMRETLTPSTTEPRPLSASYVAQFQIGIGRSLWKYRFFFCSLQNILDKNDQLDTQYFEFHDWAVGQFQQLLDDEVAAKAMIPPRPPHSTAIIAANQWHLWQSWLYFETHRAKESDLVEDLAIYHGVIQNFSLLFGMCADHFNEAFVKECQAQLHIETETSTENFDRIRRNPQSIRGWGGTLSKASSI